MTKISKKPVMREKKVPVVDPICCIPIRAKIAPVAQDVAAKAAKIAPNKVSLINCSLIEFLSEGV